MKYKKRKQSGRERKDKQIDDDTKDVTKGFTSLYRHLEEPQSVSPAVNFAVKFPESIWR